MTDGRLLCPYEGVVISIRDVNFDLPSEGQFSATGRCGICGAAVRAMGAAWLHPESMRRRMPATVEPTE